MPPTDPHTTTSGTGDGPATGGPEPSGADRIDAIAAQVAAAREAAERLAAEIGTMSSTSGASGGPGAAGAGPRGTRPPAMGYAVPGHDDRGAPTGADAIASLLGLFEQVREAIPPELVEQLLELAREILALLQALVEWAAARLEARRAAPVEVQDIPIS